MISPSISEVVSSFKRSWTEELEPRKIKEVCKEVGYSWRDRVLDPVTTIQLFLLQILHGNTSISHLRHLCGLEFSVSAYCQARKKLPLRVLVKLFECISSGVKQEECESWYGHRVRLVDGTTFSMPDTAELREHFGYPDGQREGCGFPAAHLLSLFGKKAGMLIGTISSPLRTHDISQVNKLHPELNEGDVLVGDRAFCSFTHLALILRQKSHGVFRVKRQNVNFRAGRAYNQPRRKQHVRGLPASKWLKKLGVRDQLVEWFKPKHVPSWMTKEQLQRLPQSIVVRELRYQVHTSGFRTKTVTLVTTLTDAKAYPAEDLAALYGMRWAVETNFAHLKTTMGMDVLRCKTVEGVLKELYAFCIVYNLVRLVMLEAAIRQSVHIDRISFIDALRWLTTATADNQLTFLLLVPHRKGRIEPRVKKRRPKQYKLMRKPRIQLQKQLQKQNVAA